MPRSCLAALLCLCGVAVAQAPPDEQDRLKVGLQPDGRIVVPTNQILKPAGRQVTFPGRPVDLALAGDGQSLVVKNLRGLVFLDPATGQVKQTLASPTGFSVVGLAVQGKHVYDSDAQNHVRVARRRADGQFEWADGIPLAKPPAGGAANPAGLAWRSAAELWVCSTRG